MYSTPRNIILGVRGGVFIQLDESGWGWLHVRFMDAANNGLEIKVKAGIGDTYIRAKEYHKQEWDPWRALN